MWRSRRHCGFPRFPRLRQALPQGCPYNEAIRLFAFPYQPTLLRFLESTSSPSSESLRSLFPARTFNKTHHRYRESNRSHTVSRTSLQPRLCLPQHMLSTFLREEFVDLDIFERHRTFSNLPLCRVKVGHTHHVRHRQPRLSPVRLRSLKPNRPPPTLNPRLPQYSLSFRRQETSTHRNLHRQCSSSFAQNLSCSSTRQADQQGNH